VDARYCDQYLEWRKTWSATGFLRMILMGQLGMNFSPDGVAFAPLLAGGVTEVELRGLPSRRARLNIILSGSGAGVREFRINGEETRPVFLSTSAVGDQEIVIRLGK
jgi:hypothetical protein